MYGTYNLPEMIVVRNKVESLMKSVEILNGVDNECIIGAGEMVMIMLKMMIILLIMIMLLI